MQNRRWSLTILGLLIVILCIGCNKKENEKEAYAEYPDYFREVLQKLDRNEKEHLWFSDNWDTGLKVYNEIPEEQAAIGYVDSGSEVRAEDQYIYNIKWLKLGEKSILEDITFDLSGYQAEQTRWNHAATYYKEENDMVYLVFTEFSLPPYAEPISGSHRILMLLEFKPKTPKQYNVTVFQTDEHGGVEWFHPAYCIDNTLYQMSDYSEIWSIDLITKELYYCGAEYEAAKEGVADYITKYAAKGKNVSLHHFRAVMHVDDVVIYCGDLAEAMDTPALMRTYLAYRGKELLSTMIINEETNEIEVY